MSGLSVLRSSRNLERISMNDIGTNTDYEPKKTRTSERCSTELIKQKFCAAMRQSVSLSANVISIRRRFRYKRERDEGLIQRLCGCPFSGRPQQYLLLRNNSPSLQLFYHDAQLLLHPRIILGDTRIPSEGYTIEKQQAIVASKTAIRKISYV